MKKYLAALLMVAASSAHAESDCDKAMQVLANVGVMMMQCDYPDHLQGAYNRRNYSHSTIMLWAACYSKYSDQEYDVMTTKAYKETEKLFSKYGKAQTCAAVGM